MECQGVYSAHACHLCQLDFTLQKGDLLFKSFNNYRHLGMEDLPQEFFIENSPINVEFLNIRTGEITAGAYVLSTSEIMSIVNR